MTPIRLYNSLTREKQELIPLDPGHVRLYACGPTVYNYAHIGNARMAVVFDLLVRLLRHVYPRVTYASNITDVDDKIMEAAARNPSLNGTVELFTIPDEAEAITFGPKVSFGEESPHWVVLVRWTVKEPYDQEYRTWLT